MRESVSKIHLNRLNILILAVGLLPLAFFLSQKYDRILDAVVNRNSDHTVIIFKNGSGITKDPRFPADVLNHLVRYPSEQVEFICGPQLKSGSPLNPAPWFDATSIGMGITQGERNPRIAPFGPMLLDVQTKQWENIIKGRVSVAQGARAVTGVGTAFRRDIDPGGSSPSYNGRLRIRDVNGVERAVQVRSVESDTSLTLTAPWAFSSVSNTVADTYYADASYGPNTDRYYSDNYYDLALVQYINYYRTGDTRFLEYARKTADAWWHSQWINDGTVTGGTSHLPPRSMAFAGLMLRALDGRPEMWDYLQREVKNTFTLWVYNHKSDPQLYYDNREDGYAQLYAVMLAKVLPDNYPLYSNGTLQPSTGTATDGATKRALYLNQTEDTAVNFFGRLQKSDGSWRFNVESEGVINTEQPFMTGLYLESVVLLHQLTTNTNVKTSLVNQLTSSVSHLYNDTYEKNDPVTNFPPYKWRGVFYYWGGGTVAEPNKYNPTRPRTTACGLANCGDGSVTMARHLNSTIHHAFGYAYFVTANQVYKSMGDEMFDASYGDQVDGIHCLADSGKGKDYAMNYRASGRYLIWRLAGARHAQALPGKETAGPSAIVIPKNSQPDLAQRLAACLVLAKSLTAALTDREQIKTLISQIESTQLALKAHSGRPAVAQSVHMELEAALKQARTALAIAETEPGTRESTRFRIGWAAARLQRGP